MVYKQNLTRSEDAILSHMKHRSFIIALLMVSSVAAGLFVGEYTESRSLFTDVPAIAEFSDAIQNLAMRGIVRGYGDGRFGPNDAVTRGQIAEILYRYDQQIVQPLLQEVGRLRADLATPARQEESKESQKTEESDESNAQLVPNKVEGHPTPKPIIPDEPTPASTTQPPSCGNGICEVQENDVPPSLRYHCPEDCTGAPVVRICEEKKRGVHDLAERYESCLVSSDCQKVTQTCPFITCGESINKSGVPSMKLLMKDTLETCRREGNITQCVLCVPSSPYCDNGRCTLKHVGE